MKGRVLITAGSDSGGGAGIQADIKTITALGGYAATAITALTAQDTNHVYHIQELPEEFVAQQMKVVLEDIGADCIKVGMLHSEKIIKTVARIIQNNKQRIPLVLDPVMVAKGGAILLNPLTINQLKNYILPESTIITPNIPEAEILSGQLINNIDEMKSAAEKIMSIGVQSLLLKGGHLKSEFDQSTVTDLFVTPDGIESMSTPRIDTKNTHGTGCTLSSAIACGIAQGMSLRDSVGRARDYVWEAIRTAPNLGKGHGPLNHSHTCL